MSSIRSTPRAIAAIIASSLLLAAATNPATARVLSVSNQNLRVVWSSLELTSPGVITIRCRVTLEGSFHNRAIAKVASTLLGAITKANFDTENCTNGRARARTELLPWHLTYEGFSGTLPTITSISLGVRRFRFQIIVPGICTADYGSLLDQITSRATVSAGAITTLEPIEGRNEALLFSGSTFCPNTLRFAGTGNVFLLNTTTRISVTLF